MADQVIEYTCSGSTHSLAETQLEAGSKNGLNWKWRFYTDLEEVSPGKGLDHCVYMSWTFDWDEEEMKKKEVDGFTGHIIVFYTKFKDCKEDLFPIRFDVKLTHSGQCIRKRIGTVKETEYQPKGTFRSFKMQLSLKAYKSEDISSNNCLNPKFIDAVLIVEEKKKISVNKNYLSVLSEYFDKLFNSDFKEKSMEEIPINDVKYTDFSRFLDIIHPKKPTSPTDDDAEMLLELADRFMMPAVTCHVENYLLHKTDIPFCELLRLADKFKMKKLLDRTIHLMTTLQDARLFSHFAEDIDLSDATKVRILDQIVKVLRATPI